MRILTALLLTGALTACGGGGGGGSSTPAPTSTQAAASSTPAAPSSAPASSSSLASSLAASSKAAAGLYPSYNLHPQPADSLGMESTAVQIASKIRLGFNIGNTLEAMGGNTETYWGNPKITKEFVAFVKQAGFSAIRLPVSWDQYADQTTAEIDANWLARVKEVVQYAVDSNLYVVVNIHWDGGWLENNVLPEKQEQNNAKQKAFWEQIATQLRDFDEHVLFASANEPNIIRINDIKSADAATIKTAEQQMAVLLSYHQTFIDTVRATGGKNAHRVVIVQGPDTDIDKTNKFFTKMPTDTVANKLMAEIHFYSPWNYTGMTKDESWGNQFFYWGKDFHSTTDTKHNPTWGEE
ncbi:MAG TPA: glycoside hydrolase family 5 protein, partial [Cellvibrio sp.]|nr:glycoside hydrolase family 5 protein [Cellvibrio sp.]